jgi:hypothetical protein
MPTNGQGISTGSIRQGLLKESSAFTPKTGTATGDRAASDYARGMAFSNAAQVNRDSMKANADMGNKQAQQGEQMGQQWRQAQMGRYKQLMGQRNQQSSLAAKLLEQQIGLQSDWQTSLIGMIG